MQTLLLALVLLWCLLPRLWIATVEPNHRKVYDERFSVRNAVWVLETGSLEPENGFHPSLSYLPHLPFLATSELLFRLSGLELFQVVAKRPGTKIGRAGLADGLDFTPTGYLIARGVNTVLGTLSVYLCFLIGRRLFSTRVGLLAAFFLSAVPWHLRQSAVFKPDIVLVTSILLAFLFATSVVRKPSARRYALAGVAIGLALSSKFNAPPAALPLVAASLLTWRGDRRALAKLLLAALVALTTFLILNPFVLLDFGLFEMDFGSTLKDYGKKARAADTTSFDIMASSLRWIFHEIFHGVLVASLAVAGALRQGWLLLRSARRSEQWRERLMLLLLFLGYIVVYSLVSRNPQGWHNWLVLTPLTSLLAASFVASAWTAIDRRIPARLSTPVTIVPCSLMVCVVAWPAAGFAYRQAVPRTVDLAAGLLATDLRRGEGWIVASEVALPAISHRDGTKRLTVGIHRTAALPDLGAPRLARTDAEVFGADRLRRQGAEFYDSRIASTTAERLHAITPRWFVARGQELIVLRHPWQRRKSGHLRLRADPETPGLFIGELGSDWPAQRFVSVSLWLPYSIGPDENRVVGIGNHRPALIWLRQAGEGGIFLSERVRIHPTRGRRISVRLGSSQPGRQHYPVEVYPWGKPRQPAR